MLETNSLTGLLAFFFYEHRYLSIPELGRLELSGDSSPQTDENHPHVFPKGSISFIPNPLETTDSELVEYITSRTRKMKALAIADLNSISASAREMLNMRQSYTFSGIATITPDFRGNFIVTPERMFSAPHHANRQTASEIFKPEVKEDPLQEAEIHSPGTRRTFGGTLIAIVCILIVAALVYFLFLHKEAGTRRLANNTENNTTQDPARLQDSVKTIPPDTMTQTIQKPVLSGNGLLHYEVVFEEADSARAFRRYKQLTGWGHKIIMKTKDSVNYTLAVSITSPIADTTVIKDSLRIFYGRPVYIRYLSMR